MTPRASGPMRIHGKGILNGEVSLFCQFYLQNYY